MHKIKNHSNMFWIECDPSSGSIQLYLTEIIRNGFTDVCRVFGRCLAT